MLGRKRGTWLVCFCSCSVSDEEVPLVIVGLSEFGDNCEGGLLKGFRVSGVTMREHIPLTGTILLQSCGRMPAVYPFVAKITFRACRVPREVVIVVKGPPWSGEGGDETDLTGVWVCKFRPLAMQSLSSPRTNL